MINRKKRGRRREEREKKKVKRWGNGAEGSQGRPGAPFTRMHYCSLVRVGEPQVLFWLTVVFYICCVRALLISVKFYVSLVVSRGRDLTGQDICKYLWIHAHKYWLHSTFNNKLWVKWLD